MCNLFGHNYIPNLNLYLEKKLNILLINPPSGGPNDDQRKKKNEKNKKKKYLN